MAGVINGELKDASERAGCGLGLVGFGDAIESAGLGDVVHPPPKRNAMVNNTLNMAIIAPAISANTHVIQR